MIELMPESTEDTLGFLATERLTDEDYKQTFIPKLEEALAGHDRIKVMLVLGEGFTGWDLRAMWDDATWGTRHRNDFAKLAVVGGAKWIQWGVDVAGHMMKGAVKTFDLAQKDEAWAWLES
jgi:hypothetical protein